MNVDQFLKIKERAACVLAKDLSAADSNRVTMVLSKARATALKEEIASARNTLTANKSVDGYLKGRTVLIRLKREVASTKEQTFEIERALSSITATAKSALPDYDFSTGDYPLSKKDRERLTATQAYSSTQIVFGTPVEEQCFIIPNETPKLASLGSKLELPVTLIFNRLPSDGSEYGFAMAGANDLPSTRRYTKLSLPAPLAGHVDIRCPLEFPAPEQDFTPYRDNTGAYALVYLACRRASAGKKADESDWKAVSMACRIPIAN
jgi:hypothetical protein